MAGCAQWVQWNNYGIRSDWCWQDIHSFGQAFHWRRHHCSGRWVALILWYILDDVLSLSQWRNFVPRNVQLIPTQGRLCVQVSFQGRRRRFLKGRMRTGTASTMCQCRTSRSTWSRFHHDFIHPLLIGERGYPYILKFVLEKWCFLMMWKFWNWWLL